MREGIVYLVGAGPGDPGLITVRGLECLKEADVVVYDRLINLSLLSYARRAELIDVGKRPNHHTVPQAEINAILIEKARAGKTVVRLKGGDPFVFGRGGEEAIALARAGLPFEVVPGVTSVIAAPAYAGIPVTHRKMACSVAFTTGHRENSIEDPTCAWKRLACSCDTLIFLMGVHNLPNIVEQLIANGRPPDTPIALVEKATCTDQQTVAGTLADIVERATSIRPPATIIVGEVVQLREALRWFDLSSRRPLLGLRVLNTQPSPEAEELSRRLRSLGAEPIELPTTQAVPLPDSSVLDTAINRLRQVTESVRAYDWILFTTTNSVSFFINRLFALGHDVRLLSSLRLATVNRNIAEALLDYGLVADLVSIAGPPHDIVNELGHPSDQRILLLRPDDALSDYPASNELAGLLRARGTRVESIATYTIQPAPVNPAALSALMKGDVNVVTFAAPNSLAPLTRMLDHRPVADVLSPLKVACIDQATCEAASAIGVRVDMVAEKHTIEGLIETLVRWRTDSDGHG
ncbi:MAG: uroporphyrinogen-III C-methyltransferase [Anaerolineae bacterium]